MDLPMNRRSFLSHSCRTGLTLAGLGLLGSAPTAAIQPVERSGPARLSLSLAAYSFRDSFRDNRRQETAPTDGKSIDLFQFIDFCADHGCHGTELTSYYFPADISNEFLLKLKRHAFIRGIGISGTAVGNTFTIPAGEKRAQEIASVKKWVDYAQLMGAPHIRVFAGNAPREMSKDEAKRLAVEALQECCEYAGTKGVFLGLENHGGIVAEADDLLDIVRAVNSPWFGINLDTGNFHTDDPYGDLARCAPYSVNVQVKTEIQKRGQPKQAADLARLVQIVRDARYQGYVALEYEAAENAWQAVPRILAELRKLLA
jgi:sugar phosphate isomerase/epimerase